LRQSFLLLTLTWLSGGEAAECHAKPDPNALQNLNAILTDPPVFVSEIKNAKLYSAGGPPGGDTAVPIVHLWGTPYEMGYAHGKILGPSIKQFYGGVWDYLKVQVEQALNGTDHNLKPSMAALIAEYGLETTLELEVKATLPWTGDYFNQELQGLADATGVPFARVQQIHMIGELTKGSCSMYGAWGDATKASQRGGLLQLRALDWDMDGPFKNHPEIAVYHPTPNSGNGHAFANVAWAGFIGSITGMSSAQMAISEIGVSFPDASFGKESRFGVPFTYILRDILQFDADIEAAEMHLRDAKRTCDLIFGVGDGKSNEFRSVQYSSSVANFFTDMDMEPTADWHPKVKNLVYYGMDWLCPTFTSVLHTQLEKHYGNISAASTIRDIVPIVQTGDLHVAIYDLPNMRMHVSTAKRDDASGTVKRAFDRPFIELNMTAICAEAPPTNPPQQLA